MTNELDEIKRINEILYRNVKEQNDTIKNLSKRLERALFYLAQFSELNCICGLIKCFDWHRVDFIDREEDQAYFTARAIENMEECICHVGAAKRCLEGMRHLKEEQLGRKLIGF